MTDRDPEHIAAALQRAASTAENMAEIEADPVMAGFLRGQGSGLRRAVIELTNES